jgi:GntR family transcriptional regulator
MTSHPASLFSITTGSAEPLYRQLVDQVRRLIAGGQLVAGDGMPSVRDIAHTLAMNPMTVSKAYSILEMEGVLTRRRGMGMTVADSGAGGRSMAHRAELLRPTLERAVLEAAQLEIDNDTVIALLTAILKEKS